MDWFKQLLLDLPLDAISDVVGKIVVWWSHLVQDVPANDLPLFAYGLGGVIVMILWLLVARVLPRPMGGITWVVLFAIIFAPGTALNDPGTLAPASIGVVYALMMKDTAAAVTQALPILVMMVTGLFIGFLWQLLKGLLDQAIAKAKLKAQQKQAVQQQAQPQLAQGDYPTYSTDELIMQQNKEQYRQPIKKRNFKDTLLKSRRTKE